MGKPRASSVLYRLIEAGQLARQALLLPLRARGLEAGDDAVLFLLRDPVGVGEAEIGAALGTSPAALGERLGRLAARGLIVRQGNGLVLSAEGERVRETLSEHWHVVEKTMLEGMGKARRRQVRKALGQVVNRLRA